MHSGEKLLSLTKAVFILAKLLCITKVVYILPKSTVYTMQSLENLDRIFTEYQAKGQIRTIQDLLEKNNSFHFTKAPM